MTYPICAKSTLSARGCARIAQTDDFPANEIDRLVGVIFDAARSDPKKQFDNDRGTWRSRTCATSPRGARPSCWTTCARARAGR
jgi:hypothetical protein